MDKRANPLLRKPKLLYLVEISSSQATPEISTLKEGIIDGGSFFVVVFFFFFIETAHL